MNRSMFRSYKRQFVDAARHVIASGLSDALKEAAFPAYANPNPLMSYLFWRRIRTVMSRLERRGRMAAVLDFGCGGGVMLPFLSELADRVVGVDVDLRPHRQMREHIAFADNVVVYDRPLASFATASFDVILALDVLEHVNDLTGTVSELDRVLKPGGEIIVSGPTENRAYRFGRRLAGSDYSGDYHVRDIYDIAQVLRAIGRLTTVATLVPVVPLFLIYSMKRTAPV